MHLTGERQAVDGSGQVYVGKEQPHVGIRLEEFEGLVTVHRLDHLETGVGEHADAQDAHRLSQERQCLPGG